MQTTKLERIHHPTDFSPESEVAYHHAVRLAFAAKADLDILHVDRRAHAMDWSAFPNVNETLERWQMLPAGSRGGDLRASTSRRSPPTARSRCSRSSSISTRNRRT